MRLGPQGSSSVLRSARQKLNTSIALTYKGRAMTVITDSSDASLGWSEGKSAHSQAWVTAITPKTVVLTLW